jgi:hypothetical protein
MAGSLNDVVKQLEGQRAAIEKALAALRELESPGIAPADSPRRGRPPKRKGGMTPAGRKRLSEALKARWAAKKAASAPKPAKAAKTAKTAPPAKAKSKGGITAAGRKKLSEALKARWAAKRAAATKKK